MTCSRVALVSALSWLLAIGCAHAGEIVIARADSQIRNDIVLVDADADFFFGDDALEALNSGIPLVIELELTIARRRKYLWNPEVLTVRREYTIELHPLSKQFVIADSVTGDRHGYATLDLALADLGRIRDLAVTEADALGSTDDLEFALRLRLRLDTLPAPMIPLAYLSPGWRMSSGWYRWQASR
jgi:hypothetical protein